MIFYAGNRVCKNQSIQFILKEEIASAGENGQGWHLLSALNEPLSQKLNGAQVKRPVLYQVAVPVLPLGSTMRIKVDRPDLCRIHRCSLPKRKRGERRGEVVPHHQKKRKEKVGATEKV